MKYKKTTRLSLSAVSVVLLTVHLVLCIPYVMYLGIYDASDTPWTVNGSQYPFDPVLLLTISSKLQHYHNVTFNFVF